MTIEEQSHTVDTVVGSTIAVETVVEHGLAHVRAVREDGIKGGSDDGVAKNLLSAMKI